MNKNEFINMSSTTLDEALRILSAKAAYSTEEDALSAFKIEAAIAKLLGLEASNPRHRCLNEIIKKVTRILRLEKQGWPGGTDSVKDSHLDIINYLLLHYALIQEGDGD
jgi:hypothetical protein